MMDMDSVPPYAHGQLTLAPCSVCGRNFNPDVLPRHEQACAKISQKRKVFDSTKQRHRGTELEHFLATHKPSTPKPTRKNKRNWREKHEEFVQSLRAARQVTEAIKGGRPPPPHVPSAPNPDYVMCPYCQRRFQEDTAERHIPFCKEKASRVVGNTPTGRASKSLHKRLSYKPPLPKKQAQPNKATAYSNPPGAAVVMRNTNFSQTYTISPDQSPSSYSPKESRLPVPMTRNPAVRRRHQRQQQQHDQYNADMYKQEYRDSGVSVGNGNNNYNYEDPLSPMKKTAFSKINSVSPPNNNVHSQLPPIKKSSQAPNSPPHAGSHRPSSSSNHLRSSASSRRLLAALEYSESSVDDGHYQQYQMSNEQGNGARKQRRRHQEVGTRPQANHGMTAEGVGDSHPQSIKVSQVPPVQRRAVRGGGGGGGGGGGDIPLVLHRDNSSESSVENGVSAKSQLRGVPLNQHGTPMAKYCYECGFKFPVPQAKYCCECGTKRI